MWSASCYLLNVYWFELKLDLTNLKVLVEWDTFDIVICTVYPKLVNRTNLHSSAPLPINMHKHWCAEMILEYLLWNRPRNWIYVYIYIHIKTWVCLEIVGMTYSIGFLLKWPLWGFRILRYTSVLITSFFKCLFGSSMGSVTWQLKTKHLLIDPKKTSPKSLGKNQYCNCNLTLFCAYNEIIN